VAERSIRRDKCQAAGARIRDGSTKIAIFVLPRLRPNIIERFNFERWEHEVHEDFDENCGKRAGDPAKVAKAVSSPDSSATLAQTLERQV